MPTHAFRALFTPAANAANARRCAPGRSRAVAVATFAMIAVLALASCAESPATPLPFKPVPTGRLLLPGYAQPGEGLVAVDVRRERTSNLIVEFRDAPLYIDGQRVTGLMNGEHVVLYLPPGVHRIGVTTQFDPVVEIRFVVDPRYTNRASVSFDQDHRIMIRRVAP